jgi:hypothetical protein
MSLRLAFSLLLSFILVLLAREARADKVTVLPFSSSSNATAAQLEEARSATKKAALSLKHRLPTDAEMTTAEMAIRGSTAPTTEQYRAAGRASSSDWTIAGRDEVHGGSYRLELEVCQVDTGRVESLFREIDSAHAVEQIAEMLALLLRPEGIGNADIPWLKGTPKPPPPPEVMPPKVEPPKPPPPVENVPPPVRHVYAEKHPIALGVGLSALSALRRAPNASGSAFALHLGGTFAYAIEALRGLEIRGGLSASVSGPAAILFDAGARYMFPLAPTKRLFGGPELTIGGFGTLGGERTTRFLMHSALVLALGLGERVQLELSGDLAFAPGGGTSLILGGGTMRGLFRF